MPLDAVTIHALSSELAEKTVGAKIDKVQQPERDMLLLSVRSIKGSFKLVIAAGTGNARINITEQSFENPAEPPMFCMLMRKHLVGARIAAVTQPDFERMLVLDLITHDELGFETEKKLVIEMIGRSSNIILVGSDGRIIDCIRRMDFGGDAMRRMLPGMIYREPPKQTKTAFFTCDNEMRRSVISSADRSQPVEKWLLSSFSGLSPLICRELSYRCGGDYDFLPEICDAIAESVNAGDYTPYLLTQDNKPLDFSFMRINQYADCAKGESFESFSALLDAFYSRRDKAESSRRRSHELMHSVKTVRDRIARKLANQQQELKRTEGREEVRKMAELTTANIYRLKKGMSSFECQDYYDPDCPNITIRLDPLKTPQQNTAAMFKEYNKLKAAEQHLTVLVAEGEKQLDYLNSVLDEIERAESEKDLSDIRRELIETGYIRRQKGAKPERGKPQQPMHFMSDDDYEILVGRSNVQNDELTTKTARRTDYWLHTQHVHGSHVIIRCDGLEPPNRTIEQAAIIAAYYSQGREGGKTPVDYTMVRFVRKPSGAMPGKVIYTDYKTIMVSADEELVNRLRK